MNDRELAQIGAQAIREHGTPACSVVLALDSMEDVELVRNACATAAQDAWWGMPPERKRSKWTTYHKMRAAQARRLESVCAKCAEILWRQNAGGEVRLNADESKG